MDMIEILGITIGILGAMGYLLLCLWLVKVWRDCPDTAIPSDFRPATRISVLIPARNEEAGIATCVSSVLQQDYPPQLLEVVVIDDYSEDKTASIVKGFQDDRLKLIHLAEYAAGMQHRAFKKQALSVGLQASVGSLIVQTDADCVAPPGWLREIAFLWENNGAECILGPVHFRENENLLGRFQALEMTGMMLVTAALAFAGKPFLANGANLAYSRKAFERVGGFSGQTHLASGDDIMLVHKIGKVFPGRVTFSKSRNVAVETSVQPDWASFVAQRTRWATKTGNYAKRSMTLVLGGIFLFCTFVVTIVLIGLILGSYTLCLIGISSLLAKALADYYLLSEACRYYQREHLLHRFWITEMLHLFYMVLMGVLGLTRRTYNWKGRRVQ
jgi:biofilm PGA synthesis N-glycosyltransferase PgaC